MARDNLYRNSDWSPEVASVFEAKLVRARDKAQYLRIQASTLRESLPEVAHALLDRYFAMPDHFDWAQGFVDRAVAYLSQGKLTEALVAYERALAREASFPKLKTQAYLDLPFLVATNAVQDRYDAAVEVLESHKARLMFPVDHFKWNAAQALIASARGDAEAARDFAKVAIEAAAMDSSGLRYHPTVGLVPETLVATVRRMHELSDA